MDLGQRLVREKATFNRADDFLLIRRHDFRRGLCIEFFQDSMKVTRPVRAGGFAETLAQFFRTLRQLRQTFEQRAKIQSCTSGNDRQFAPQS